MYDSGILTEENLVLETNVERIARTVSIARGSVVRYHVRVHDVVLRNAVVTRRSIEPGRGHFDTWEKAQEYSNQQVAAFKEEGFASEPATKQLLRMWTLYNNSPQRHYRQIAARYENNTFFVMVLEGAVLSVDPFNKAFSSRKRHDCGNAGQALKKAQELYESSIGSGWSEYHPAYC